MHANQYLTLADQLYHHLIDEADLPTSVALLPSLNRSLLEELATEAEKAAYRSESEREVDISAKHSTFYDRADWIRDIPDDAIKIEKPFKELGTFDVPVATADTFGKFSITIGAE